MIRDNTLWAAGVLCVLLTTMACLGVHRCGAWTATLLYYAKITPSTLMNARDPEVKNAKKAALYSSPLTSW